MRGAETWILTLALFIALVPAFSLTYPPAYRSQSTTQQICECKPCVAFHLSRFYPTGSWRGYFEAVPGIYDGGVYYIINFPQPQPGHRYFMLLNISSDISISEVKFNCVLVEEEYDYYFVCDEISFHRLNATHVYAFTNREIRNLEFTFFFPGEMWSAVKSIYVDVYLVKETTTLQEILQYLN